MSLASFFIGGGRLFGGDAGGRKWYDNAVPLCGK